MTVERQQMRRVTSAADRPPTAATRDPSVSEGDEEETKKDAVTADLR